MKILSLSPHYDDSELGAGAFLHKAVNKGHEVHVVGFSGANQEGIHEEFSNSMGILGPESVTPLYYEVREFYDQRQHILDEMIQIRDDIQPNIVLCPATDDVHQDHQVITAEAKRAFKHSSILGYELPWNNWHFKTDCFQVVTEDDIYAKIGMILEYRSQHHREYIKGTFIRSLAEVRGLQAGAHKEKRKFAECFELIRTTGEI